MKIIQIQINKPIPGHAAGSIARVQADDAGVPFDKSWRDRLRDAKIDDCVTVVKKAPKTSNKVKEKS